MHVVQLQTQAPKAAPKPSNTSHAFLPATAKVATVAEAVAMTEELRHSQQAANRQVESIDDLLESFCLPHVVRVGVGGGVLVTMMWNDCCHHGVW